MIESLKTRVREAVWGWLGPQSPPQNGNGHDPPLGIDRLAKLPVHYEPPECPLCTAEEGFCYDCGGQLADPLAPFGTGVESATVTHLHLHAIPDSGGRQVRIEARRKLCIPCFRIDWAKAYPDKKCDL